MADFVSVLRRAVENLEDNSEATRAALYGKARAALLRQLQTLDPPLSEDELARQTEELDDAIASLEAEFATDEARADVDAHTDAHTGGGHEPEPRAGGAYGAPGRPRDDAPADRDDRPDAAAAAAAAPPAFLTPSGAPRPSSPSPSAPPPAGPAVDDPYSPSPAHQSFRTAVAETESLGTASSSAARSARDALGGFGDDEHERFPDDDARDRPSGAESGRGAYPDDPGAPPPSGGPTHGSYDGGYDEPGSEGVFRFAVWGIVALVLAGLVGVGFWQREAVMQIVTSFTSDQADGTGSETKISDRVPVPGSDVDGGAPDADGQAQTPQDTGTSEQQPTEQARSEIEPSETLDPETRVAQALLVEEADRSSGATNSLGGSVDWTLVDDPEVPGGEEKVIRATIRVPDKNMSIAMAIRRNLDESLPASHTIELLFDLPPEFENGGIERVPGMVMKATPQSAGQPLVGAVVPVTGNFFLIGLSQTDIDRRRNIEELQRRAFMDIPLVYADGTRALLSIAKGESGGDVFAEAFEAWGG